MSKTVDGYRGVWYFNQPSGDEYVYKYSGGLGTYCAKHLPMAVYAPEADKTFFVYGGADSEGSLLEMIGFYDHTTGTVPRPTVIMAKDTDDAHHNPTISIDSSGFIWVFVSSHGGEDAFIFRSNAPYSIDDFQCVSHREFTYPQPWYIEGMGHVFLHTIYTNGRELYVANSEDGKNWTDSRKYVGFGGHYQVSWRCEDRIGTAFNWHPPEGGLNARTNLYYMETADGGKTWQTIDGKQLITPLDSPQNDALLRNYQSEGLLVYLKNLCFDADGNPVVLYILSRGYESGPQSGPRVWTTARWTGTEWLCSEVTTSDHNYDTGSLYIEADGTWRVIGPTETGPQACSTGGEMAMWESKDQGKTWRKTKQLTHNSELNHTYARRPLNAHPGFYAFWADGNPLKPSKSRLYFTDKAGNVRRLPTTMSRDFEIPEPV